MDKRNLIKTGLARCRALTVKPGESRQIALKFGKAGIFKFLYVQLGHFDTEMKGQIKIPAK